MNHQPFELWLLEPDDLEPEQRQELEDHLKNCSVCRQTQSGINRLNAMITQIEPATPAPGFTARFQASLEMRRKKQHQKQVRRALLVLGSMLMLISLVIFGSLLLTGSFVKTLGLLIGTIANIPLQIEGFRYIFYFWTTNLPDSIQVLLSFTISSWVFLLLIPWILTFVRFNQQGVEVK